MSIASRITAIEEHITDDYNALSDIGADLTGVDKNIENIKGVLEDIYDDMPKVSDTGTDILLDGTRAGKMTMQYGGDTQQDSTTGKNIYDFTKTSATANEQTISANSYQILLNGTNTSATTFSFTTINLQAGTYTYQQSWNSGSIASGTYQIQFHVNGTNINNLRITTDYTNNYSYTFTLEENSTFQIKFYSAGNSPVNATNYKINANIISGNTPDYTYEPYTNGASPNPNYPQPINVVTGRQELKICGKNLWGGFDSDISRTSQTVDFVNKADGSITANGTSTGNAYSLNSSMALSNNRYITLEAGKYTLSGGTSTIRINLTDLNGINIANTSTTTFKDTITLNEKTQCFVRLQIDNGNTADNVTIYPMLVKGETASEYEAYTGYTQEINLGKNLISAYNRSSGGNQLYFNDVADYGNNYIFEAGTYTLSYTNNGSNSISTFVKEQGGSSTNKGSNNPITFTTTEKFNVWLYRNGLEEGEVSNPQLEKGNKASTYSSYFTPIELCKISTYQDYIYKENDRWFLHKEIGKVVLDGSEDGWAHYGGMIYIDNYINDYKKIEGTTCIANYFKGSANGTTTQDCYNNGNNTISFRIGDTLNRLLFRDDDISTYNDFKTWLSTHNTIVYYVLNEATETEITNSELVEQLENIKRSYNEQTNISQDNSDLPIIITASALKEWE